MSHKFNPFVYLVYFDKKCYGWYVCSLAYECIHIIAIEVYYYFIKPKSNIYMAVCHGGMALVVSV